MTDVGYSLVGLTSWGLACGESFAIYTQVLNLLKFRQFISKTGFSTHDFFSKKNIFFAENFENKPGEGTSGKFKILSCLKVGNYISWIKDAKNALDSCDDNDWCLNQKKVENGKCGGKQGDCTDKWCDVEGFQVKLYPA